MENIPILDLTEDSDTEEKVGDNAGQDFNENHEDTINRLQQENFILKCQNEAIQDQLRNVLYENNQLARKLRENSKCQLKNSRETTTSPQPAAAETTTTNPSPTPAPVDSREKLIPPEKSQDREKSLPPTKKRSSPQKVIPLKYLIEQIDKYAEEKEIRESFAKFGNIKEVIIREKGILRYSGEFSSAVVTFSSINREITSHTHQIRKCDVKIRPFEKTDFVDASKDDWEDKEKNSPFPSTKQSNSSISSSPPAKIRRQSIHSSRASSESSTAGTRSVMITDTVFDNELKDQIETFFCKHGKVEKLTRVRSRSNPEYQILFIKFDSYESADSVLAMKYADINGTRYHIRPAKDF